MELGVVCLSLSMFFMIFHDGVREGGRESFREGRERGTERICFHHMSVYILTRTFQGVSIYSPLAVKGRPLTTLEGPGTCTLLFAFSLAPVDFFSCAWPAANPDESGSGFGLLAGWATARQRSFVFEHKQPERNYKKLMFPQTAISYVKDHICHIGTTISFWLFGVPGGSYG